MKSVLNEMEIQKCIEHIKFYIKEENINFDNIIKQFGEINYNYDTENLVDLANRCFELESKFNIINKIYESYVLVLQKNLNNYKEASGSVEVIMEDIYK